MPRIFVLLIFLVVGCASTRQYVPFPDQTKLVENPEMARIYVIRPSVVGFAIKTEIKDGRQTIGYLGAKQFLCWERKEGETVISGKSENESSITLNLVKGHVYYIEQHIHLGIWKSRNRLSLLTPLEGRKKIAICQNSKEEPK